MKPGELVRYTGPLQQRRSGRHARSLGTGLGLLVEYNVWEKLARIMPIPYAGEIVTVHASHVQKAGKKDIKAIEDKEGI